MSFQGLDLGAYLRESEVLSQQQVSSTSNSPENPEELEIIKAIKSEDRRRLRNVLSSRNYRMKKRNQMKKLEEDNSQLRQNVYEAEDQLQRLNAAFHLFVQHAEHCHVCCNIRISDEPGQFANPGWKITWVNLLKRLVDLPHQMHFQPSRQASCPSCKRAELFACGY